MSNNFTISRNSICFILIFFIFISNAAQAQTLAFPGAEGAGKYTTGGRGSLAAPTTVFQVTKLTDDGSVGTFRYAVTHANVAPSTSRTVVFLVSGTIHLTSPLNLRISNMTIAGQTAPGNGICIADEPVLTDANNIIVRYMRFRMGDKNEDLGEVNGSGNDDAFDGTGYNHLIIDHCTMSWGDDESCTFYRGDSTTLQWNMVMEPLNYSYHFETGDTGFEHHGFGGIWGGRHFTGYHNMFVDCQGRACRFDGSRNLAPVGGGSTGVTAGLENADFVNNVIYNWGGYNTNGGEGGNYNIINNYYKSGPSTSTNTASGVSTQNMIINPYNDATLPYGQYYMSGNYMSSSTAVTNDNWKGAAMNGGTQADTSMAKVTTQFTVNVLPTVVQTPADAYDTALLFAGAFLPQRDTLDQRIIGNVINNTGHIIDCQGGFPHGTAYALTVNAWPSLYATTAASDSDHDGMPDYWELANGSNPYNANNRDSIAANGYTQLENYLNGISLLNHAPVFTGGRVQTLSACENMATSIDSVLTISDSDAGQTETWSVLINAFHGTVSLDNAAVKYQYTATSTGGTVVPAGLTYTPATGYTGTDSFTVIVKDGATINVTKIIVTITSAPVLGTISGASTVVAGTTTNLTDTTSGGTWTSSNAAATVSTGGVVTGVTPGVDTISYSVIGSCGTQSTTKVVTVDSNTTGIQYISGTFMKANVYPNPAGDAVFAKTNDRSDFTMVITDMLGRRIASNKSTNGSVAISIQTVPAGSYIVTLSNTVGEMLTTKITIVH